MRIGGRRDFLRGIAAMAATTAAPAAAFAYAEEERPIVYTSNDMSMSRRNTSFSPFVSPATMFVA